MRVHAICVLSNHYHCVITDVDGQLPKFLASAHRLIAKCLNTHYKRWENLWSSDEPSVVRLEDDLAILDKIVYTLANPVSSFLVEFGDWWPGVRTKPADLAGVEYEVSRPEVFFRADGDMPERVILRLERPDVCSSMSDSQLVRHVDELVAQREAGWRATRMEQGLGFVGVSNVLRQNPWDTPETTAPRRTLSPRLAAGDPEVLVNALRRMATFETGYREARLAWGLGDRSVVFPAGTYAMRVNHGVACATGLSP